jgi:TRAP-type C4-dicarboxylate transport system permease small subunit
MKQNTSKFKLYGESKCFEHLLIWSSKSMAIGGGTILVAIVFINFISIFGRIFFSRPLVGDFELIEMGCAIAIFMFLPLCQIKNGNVIVDLFTANLGQRKKIALNGFGIFLFGLMASFFSWRMIFGFLDMLHYNEQTMLLQLPVWIAFVPAILSFILLSLVCFYYVYKNILLFFFKKAL